ncbi:MAG: NUDIX domain-containing protein, partial [Chloroflexi bacterium]|nr:NUDIX domain-containing protein [Chloroflexota bacterium]
MSYKRKVYANITHAGRLLVFRHVDYPEAGLQVQGGTEETGESFEAALRRQVREETGLGDGLELAGLVGEQARDMSDFGMDETQRQRFYHLVCVETPPERWLHTEEHASDGSGSLAFEFYWVDLDDAPGLAGVQGIFIDRLKE